MAMAVSLGQMAQSMWVNMLMGARKASVDSIGWMDLATQANGSQIKYMAVDSTSGQMIAFLMGKVLME
jgi:hypothetical protein